MATAIQLLAIGLLRHLVRRKGSCVELDAEGKVTCPDAAPPDDSEEHDQ